MVQGWSSLCRVWDSPQGLQQQEISSMLQLLDHISSPWPGSCSRIKEWQSGKRTLHCSKIPPSERGCQATRLSYLSFVLLSHSDNKCYLMGGGSYPCYELFSAVLDKAYCFLLCLCAHWKLEIYQRTQKYSNLHLTTSIPLPTCVRLFLAKNCTRQLLNYSTLTFCTIPPLQHTQCVLV